MVNYKVFSSYNVQRAPIFFWGLRPPDPRIIVVLCWSTERLYHCRKHKIKYIQRRRRKFCGFLVQKAVLCWSTERLYHCRKLKITNILRRRRKFCGFPELLHHTTNYLVGPFITPPSVSRPEWGKGGGDKYFDTS